MAAVNNSEPRKLDRVQRGGVVFRRGRYYAFTYAGHKSAGRQVKPKVYIGRCNHIWVTQRGERCMNVQLLDTDEYRTVYVYGVTRPREIRLVDAA